MCSLHCKEWESDKPLLPVAGSSIFSAADTMKQDRVAAVAVVSQQEWADASASALKSLGPREELEWTFTDF